MTTKKPSSKVSSPVTNLPFLEPLAPLVPPSPPTFPRFEDLVEEDAKNQMKPPTKRAPTDLFSGFLGNHIPLIEDYQKHPEKYGVETHELLELLMQGSRSVERLDANERRLLNLATLDYYQSAPAKREGKNKTLSKTAAPKSRVSRIRKPRPQRPVRAELPAFWWES